MKSCYNCASTEHTSPLCPYQDDRTLGEEVRAEEKAAIEQIATLLVAKVRRPFWTSALSASFRKASRAEENADVAELRDVIASMNADGEAVRRG